MLAVGTYGTDGTLTIEINPDPSRESWFSYASGGSNLTLTATNIARVLQIPGVYVRLKANNNATGMDLNVWVSGKGVSLVSAEPT